MFANRILIADDDNFYRYALASSLRGWDYEVVEANNGTQAFEYLRAEDAPKIAIIDWMMPGMTGVQVCQAVRSLSRAEPTYLVILTSKEGKESAIQALRDGADDYIQKPFHAEELRARLRVGERIVGLQTSQMAVFALARASEAKSPYTQGHADRVAHYSLALAADVGITTTERETLRRGAVLHDIGKICTPDQVLNKPDRLTPEEFNLIKEHPIRGEEIIRPFKILRDVLPLIRSHHERPNGKGYPDSLAGDEIALLVRILSVADVYDALRSARPYRQAVPHEQTLLLLREEANQGHLDSELVGRFCGLEPSVFADFVDDRGCASYRLSGEGILLQDCA